MYFDRYLGSHAMLCRHFFSKCHVIKISKIFGDFVSLCQGLLPTSRHFEHRQGEGPGDEVGMTIYQCYVVFMNAMFNISTSKHIHYKLKVSDKTKRRRGGNDVAKQEVMSLRTQTPRKSKS